MMPVLLLIAIWGGIGYTMIMYLAGLQTISARILRSGDGRWRDHPR